MEFIIFGSSHLIGLFFSIKENSFVRNNDFETISTNIHRILWIIHNPNSDRIDGFKMNYYILILVFSIENLFFESCES